MNRALILILGLIGVLLLSNVIKSWAQIPTSYISSDCSTAYVNSINPSTNQVDTSTYSSAQINAAIAMAQTAENKLRQQIAQDDVTIDLYLPLQYGIAECLANQQSNQANAS